MKKALSLTLLAAALCSTASFAQFYIGGGIGLNKYGGDYGKFHPSIQPRLGYDYRGGRASILAGFNFSPVKGKSDFEGPSEKITQEVSMQNAFLHALLRLGDPENTFHFKFIFGASLDMISIKYKSDADISDEYPNESTTGPKLDLGIGGDFKMGNGDMFVELLAGLPANQANGQYIYNPTVAHFGLSVGYNFYFGNREDYYEY